MFDLFSWSHILILLTVALVVVGPKDLPRLMNIAGRWAGKARNMANEFKKSFDDMARQSELDELRAEVEKLRSTDPIADLGADINLTQHWGVSAYGNRDLIQNAWVIRDVGVFYKDECIRVDVFYRHEDVIIGRLGSSDQLSIRLTLATLGAPFYGQ